jgi:hypothetical protein
VDVSSYFYAAGFVIASAAVCFLVWRWIDWSYRVPLAVYLGFYVVTNVIGAALIALVGPEVVDSPDLGLDLSFLEQLDTLKYWGLLFAPLLITPLVALACCRLHYFPKRTNLVRVGQAAGVQLVPFLLVFGGFSGYCFLLLYQNGYLYNLDVANTLNGDYFALMILRNDMFTVLRNHFFGFVYITLPTLSMVALYQAVRQPGWAWLWAFLFTVLVTAILCLVIIQKSLITLYVVCLGIGLLELKVIRLRTLAIFFAGAFVLLTLLQSIAVEDWSIGQSVDLVIYRLACSYPYYLVLYPDAIPHFGIDFGFHYLGLVDPPQDNVAVFNYMYPTVNWIQGAVAAPAHVRAYAQAGVLFSLLTLASFGVFIKLVGDLHRNIRGPLSFGMYIQSLVFLYYLTQISLVDAVLSSYGIVWAVVGLSPLWVLMQLPSCRQAVPVQRKAEACVNGQLTSTAR